MQCFFLQLSIVVERRPVLLLSGSKLPERDLSFGHEQLPTVQSRSVLPAWINRLSFRLLLHAVDHRWGLSVLRFYGCSDNNLGCSELRQRSDALRHTRFVILLVELGSLIDRLHSGTTLRQFCSPTSANTCVNGFSCLASTITGQYICCSSPTPVTTNLFTGTRRYIFIAVH
jgi:hypothetical protein